MKIVNINEMWGMGIEFEGDTEADCVQAMVTAIRECGADYADVLAEHGQLVEGIDYEVVNEGDHRRMRKMGAFDKGVGFVLAVGASREELMSQLSAIGECQEDDFDFLPITDRLVRIVERDGGDVRTKMMPDGVVDYDE